MARSTKQTKADPPPKPHPGRVLLPWLVLVIVASAVVALAMGTGEETARTSRQADAKAATPPRSTTPVAKQPPVSTEPAPLRVPQVSFDPPMIQWGFLKPGEVKQMGSTVTNEGSEPIRFTGNMKGCSCTTVEIPAIELAPGASVPFTATMTAGLTPTTKSGGIKLLLAEHEAIRIPTDGEIVRGIRVSPRRISAISRPGNDRSAPATPAGSRRVRFDAPEGTPFRILRIDGQDVSSFAGAATLSNPMPVQTYVFDDFAQYDPETGLNAQGELLPLFRLVETDHPAAPVIEVPVDHPVRIARLKPRGERPWFWVENRYVADTVAPGQSAVIEIPLLVDSKRPWEAPTGARSLDGKFDARLLDVTPDGRKYKARVQISPAATENCAWIGELELTSDNFAATVPVIGAVRVEGAPR
ncbi:MAG: DUF1573 domain-containing protein [Phycisphaerales bacterium]|nr:DUF1573 domain-containing protein [Phycisphaerales bacterium]